MIEDLLIRLVDSTPFIAGVIVFMLVARPIFDKWLDIKREKNEQAYELEKKQLETYEKISGTMASLDKQVEASQRIVTIQIDGMTALVKEVEAMTKKVEDFTDRVPGDLDEIKTQIAGLPNKVWETGDPKLKDMTDELKTCLDASVTSARILELLERIIAHLEKEDEKEE
jgi:hypothetical protein